MTETSRAHPTALARIEIDPARLKRDLVRLVLILVEFLRWLLESQALIGCESGTRSEAEAERLGAALAGACGAVLAIAGPLDIYPSTLILDLGSPGRLV